MSDQFRVKVLHRRHNRNDCPQIPFLQVKNEQWGVVRELGSVLRQISAREVSIQIDSKKNKTNKKNKQKKKKKVHCWCVPATCIHIDIYTYTPTHTQACEGFCTLIHSNFFLVHMRIYFQKILNEHVKKMKQINNNKKKKVWIHLFSLKILDFSFFSTALLWVCVL